MLVFLSSLRGLCQRLFDRPMSNTVCKPALVYSNNFSPLRETMRFAAESDIDIVAGIALLFKFRSPPAVFRGVITVWVNAIKAVFLRWSRSHVVKKCLKIVQPSIAHLDTAPSIVRKVFLIWISAASKHVLPARIGQTIDHPVSCEHLATKATTAQRCATFERINRNVSIISARTSAIQISRLDTASNNSPAAKCIAYKVLRFLGNWGIIVHVGSLLSRLSAKHLGVTASQVHFVTSILPQKRGKMRTYTMPYWGKFEDVMNG